MHGSDPIPLLACREYSDPTSCTVLTGCAAAQSICVAEREECADCTRRSVLGWCSVH